MKLFYSHNKHYSTIFDLFKKSIKDNWEIREKEVPDFKHKDVMAGGIEGNIMRRDLINFAFESTGRDELFVVSDVDIIFYKPCIPLVLEKFKNKQKVFINGDYSEKDLDICFQKENLFNGRINMGFMAIKNNQRTISFFKELYDKTLPKNLWDQPELDNMLHENLHENVRYQKNSPKDADNIAYYINNHNNLIWDTFPAEIWNMSIGLNSLNSNIYLHHANCAVTQTEKCEQFANVKQLLILQ